MKSYVYIIAILVITFFYLRLLDYFGVSYLVSILSAFPILFYVIIYSTIRYNFRKSLNLQPIPQKGYDARINQLEKNSKILYSLGFKKFDEFYLPIANDVISYAYYNEEYATVLCDYHFGQKNCYEFVSKFENDYTLTTSCEPDSGLIPRNNENMLQIFPKRSFEELFNEHLVAEKFLQQRQYNILAFNPKSFRIWFLHDYHKIGKDFKNILSPIKLFYWKISNNKTKYIKSVEEQFLSKTLQIPNN